MVAVHYEPPKPRPMVRPAYLNFVPSPAAVSFNFALASYQPDELEHQSTGELLHTILSFRTNPVALAGTPLHGY